MYFVQLLSQEDVDGVSILSNFITLRQSSFYKLNHLVHVRATELCSTRSVLWIHALNTVNGKQQTAHVSRCLFFNNLRWHRVVQTNDPHSISENVKRLITPELSDALYMPITYSDVRVHCRVTSPRQATTFDFPREKEKQMFVWILLELHNKRSRAYSYKSSSKLNIEESANW